MDDVDGLNSQRTTEWALLFPLRTGLLSLKSSFNNLTETDNGNYDVGNNNNNNNEGGLNLKNYLSEENIIGKKKMMTTSDNIGSYGRSSVENLNKLRNRRRSSMSDMDKIEGLLKEKASDISLTVTSKPYENGSISTPNSPQAHYMRHMQKSDNLRGSIGDFMNLKRFGVNSGIVTESIIAKTVPLTTVTRKKKTTTYVKTYGDDDDDDGAEEKTKSDEKYDDKLMKTGNRKRKCGVAFTENIIMQHIVRNISGDDVTRTKEPGSNNNNNNNNMDDADSLGSFIKSDVVTAKKYSKQFADNSAAAAGNINGIKKITQVPLSGSQRTERLSRIIKQHNSTHQLYANIYVSC